MKPEIDPRLLRPAAGPASAIWWILFTALTAVGTATFLVGISGSFPERSWQAFLFNYVFWAGLAFGSVIWVAVWNLTNAQWVRPLKRLAESPGAFLPLVFALFWVIFAGREKIFPWIGSPDPKREFWLNVPFLFTREGICLGVLMVLCVVFIFSSARSDRRDAPILALRENPLQFPPGEPPLPGNWRRQMALSVTICIFSVGVLTLVSFDLIMSLKPEWSSTLFGWYYFTASLYTGLAWIIVLSVIANSRMGLKPLLPPRVFHDLGKILLGFAMLTGDFFYSQFLMIWYGNLPRETRFVIARVQFFPWDVLAWVILIASFVLPFFVLLSRKVKLKPVPLLVLSLVILGGMWLERFVLVVPSLWTEPGIPLGWPEVLVGAGFLGALGLCTLAYLSRFPLLPISDPLFRKSLEKEEKLTREWKEFGP